MLSDPIYVVYFDQPTHACACVRMVENDQNHSKMTKKVPFLSCVREAYEQKRRKKSFSYDFDRFRPCDCMRKHAFVGRNTQQI